MPILAIYRALRTIALDEFADVVVSAQVLSLPNGKWRPTIIAGCTNPVE